MNGMAAYIPIDRRWAIIDKIDLPNRASGSVLFADISGFTPLTAALLKELGPKRGPEELTRQLNLVYDALIAEVHRYGGSVIGFSGDAITCWLNQDEGQRGVTCGLSLQNIMGQFTSIKTPAGTPVSLGLKVAVAAGSVRRYLVGNPNIQIMDALAGSTLDRVAAAEHHANKGEVIVSPEVLEALEETAQITTLRPKTKAPFAVISNLTQPAPTQPWPDAPTEFTHEQARPWLLGPIYERLKSGQTLFLAEIRPATALFLRFGGINYDNDNLAGEKLDGYIRWVQSILTRHNGFLLQLTIGDKGSYMYAAFGAPITSGNNMVKAVAAAVELQTLPPELTYIGPVQIGISQGRMRTGAYGGLARRTYGVLGDEVNMAARLMGKSRPGQIMVSQKVAAAAESQFLLQSLGLIAVKGKSEPIPAALVLGRRRQSARKPVGSFATPLVGRSAELAELQKTLTCAKQGKGKIVRIQGVAGIGKSHLVAEFAEQALHRQWRVVLGVCQSTGREISYLPWRQIFRALLALIDESLDSDTQIKQVETTITGMNPEWQVRLPLLGDVLELPIPDNPTTAAFDPRLRREALFTLLLDLIEQWATVQPLLILLDDVHWLDEASREFIVALARVTPKLPVLLVVVHRPPLDENQAILPEIEDNSGCQNFLLNELSPEGIAAAVTYRLQGAPSPLLQELIQLEARGNPFMVEELVNTLKDLKHLTRQTDGAWTLSQPIINALWRANCLTTGEAGEWLLNPNVPLPAADLGLPDSIHGLVLARIDRLRESHKLTLKVASVIGRFFQFHLLAQAHPRKIEPDNLRRQVENFERRDFTRQETPPPLLAYIFKHNIVRDVAYESLLKRQQQELHRAVAEATEQLLPDAVEQLALHFSRAGVRKKAMLYLDKAARKARREYANETALNYFEQALAFEERWQWRKGQVEVLHILGRRKKERAAITALAALPDAPLFEANYLWGQYFEATGDYAQAQKTVEQALDIAQANNNQLAEAQCLSLLGLVTRRQGNYGQAQTQYMDVLTLFPAEDEYAPDESRVLIGALNGLGITLRQQGKFEQAKLYYNWGLTLCRTNNNLRDEAMILNSLGVNAFYVRNLAEAKTYYQEALKIQRQIGDRAGFGISLTNLATVARNMGDYDQAQNYYLQALSILQSVGNRWEEVNIWNSMGIAHQELGDFANARTYLQTGIELAREINDEIGQAYLLVNLGLVACDSKDYRAAINYQDAGLAIARKHNEKYLVTNCLYHTGMTYLKLNDLDPAIKNAQASLDLQQKQDMRLSSTGNLTVLGKAFLLKNNHTQAQSYVEQALVILDECRGKGPEFPQLDYFLCYQVFMAVGQETQAKSALQAAYALVMARADKISAPSLRQSFLENVTANRDIIAAYRATKLNR